MRASVSTFFCLVSSSRALLSRSGGSAFGSGASVRRLLAMSPTAMHTMSQEKPASTPRTVVLGGGLAGLASALALRRVSGLDPSAVQVCEASSETSFADVNAGAGAQLGPNGLRAIRAMGGEEMLNRVLAASSPLEGSVVLLPHGPMIVPDTTGADTIDGLSQVFIRWGVLRKILTEALLADTTDAVGPLIQTSCGTNVGGYRLLKEEGNEQCQLQLVDQAGQDLENVAPCDLLIGAEGVASVTRYLVNTKTTQVPDETNLNMAAKQHIRDTGRVNLKAAVPKELSDYFLRNKKDSKDSSFCPNHTYAWFAAPPSGVGCFCGPAGSDHTYWAVSVADDETTKEQFLADAGEDADKIKATLLTKLKAEGAAESCPFILSLIDDTDPEAIRVSRSEETTGVGPSLVSHDGKVVLVGDAAHSMSLAYGQNPNFALEDAVVLASCLREALSSKEPDAMSIALQKYSKTRVSRCLEMQRRSEERAAKAMKGEQAEDVSKWIFEWQVDTEEASAAEKS